MGKQDQNYYELLGVDPKASARQIKKAYLELVAQYHPDRHQGNPLEQLAREKLVAINMAYETLVDAKRRSAYDKQLFGARVPTSMRTSKAPALSSEILIRRILLTALVLLTLPLTLRIIGPFLRMLLRLLRLA